MVFGTSLILICFLLVGCGQTPPSPSGPAAQSRPELAPDSKSNSTSDSAALSPKKPAVQSADVPAEMDHEVSIAAASDLRFALDELLTEFANQQPNIKAKATYGSSGNFYSQLVNRAPFDMFLSADVDYPHKLVEQDLGLAKTEFSYAVGHIVVWVSNQSPLKVEETGIHTLLDPSLKKIAIANPKVAPYGRAAEAALKSLQVYDKIKEKLVLAENIAQAAHFVESGSAEIGILSQSLSVSPAMKDKGRSWLVPETAHPAIEQGGVIMNWAKDRESAEALRAFLTSDVGRAILKKYGFAEP